MIFGSYKQVFIIKFYKWEMFGTAFDPPIPATIQPTILIMGDADHHTGGSEPDHRLEKDTAGLVEDRPRRG